MATLASLANGRGVQNGVGIAFGQRSLANAPDNFAQDVTSALSKWEAKRRVAMRVFLAIATLGFLAAAIEYLSARTAVGVVLAPVIFVCAAVLGYIPYYAVCHEAWTDTNRRICEPFGVTYRRLPKETLQLEEFYALHLLAASLIGDVINGYCGARRSVSFAFCQASAGYDRVADEFIRRDLLRISTPQRRYARTVILHRHAGLNEEQSPPNLRHVGLEDPRFNEDFVVYGSDQIEAREILTPVFIEKLSAMAAAFGGNLSCAFSGSEFLVAVDSRTPTYISRRLTDPTFVREVSRRLQYVVDMVDFFANESG